MTLSPVPVLGTQAEQRALAYFRLHTGLRDDRAEEVLHLCSALVEREAPAAPQSVRNEACVRLGGFLRESGSGALREKSIGGDTIAYRYAVDSLPTMFASSGARGLLAPWKARRAR